MVGAGLLLQLEVGHQGAAVLRGHGDSVALPRRAWGFPVVDELAGGGVIPRDVPPVAVVSTSSTDAVASQLVAVYVSDLTALVLVSSEPANTSNYSGTVLPFLTTL